MGRRLAAAGAVLLAAAAAGLWAATAPQPFAGPLPERPPDPANGERVFHAGGCAACHAAPGAKGAAKLALAGGQELKTPFGTFRVPNISPDPQTGIGGWSAADLAGAMLRGVSPDGRHYYPAFPYTSYARMRPQDVVDLKAFLDTLPPVRNAVGGHDLAFPYNIRRGLGLWKRLYLDSGPVLPLAAAEPLLQRGRYLVEALGHCGECHTPRDAFGGMETDEWLAGAPNPEGKGVVPNITPHEQGIGGWSAADIVYALESGFLPDFDTFSGAMVAVQENLARLPDEDRQAIAAYLKAVPPRPDAVAETAPR